MLSRWWRRLEPDLLNHIDRPFLARPGGPGSHLRQLQDKERDVEEDRHRQRDAQRGSILLGSWIELRHVAQVDPDNLGGFAAITLPATALFEHLSKSLASFYVNKPRRVFLPYILVANQRVWNGMQDRPIPRLEVDLVSRPGEQMSQPPLEETRTLVADDPQLLAYLPMLYVAWADGDLSADEIGSICSTVTKALDTEASCRELLGRWLDPAQPPSAQELQSLLVTIRGAARTLDTDQKRSLSELGLALATVGGHQASAADRNAGAARLLCHDRDRPRLQCRRISRPWRATIPLRLGEFVVHTPHESCRQGLHRQRCAVTVVMATVFAQLVRSTGDHSHGVHALLVPIREHRR